MAGRDSKLMEKLAAAGIDETVGAAVLDLDAILQRWRRRVVKRELGIRALSDLDLPIDIAQLDVLSAIWAPSNEYGTKCEGETMVSTVASRLGIDPSRASRITTELIRMGLVRRAVSQQDARRTILELTEDGDRVVAAARQYKFLRLGSFLKDWTDEELAVFIPLIERFSAWSEADTTSDSLSEEIARLRAELPDLSSRLS